MDSRLLTPSKCSFSLSYHGSGVSRDDVFLQECIQHTAIFSSVHQSCHDSVQNSVGFIGLMSDTPSMKPDKQLCVTRAIALEILAQYRALTLNLLWT